MARDGVEEKISPRSMNVLVHLAERPGEVVTHEELLAKFWRGTVSPPNAVHKCVAELRRVFGNGGSEPTFIETVPKRGYRLLAAVAEPERVGEAAQNGTASIRGAISRQSAAALVEQVPDVVSTLRVGRLVAAGLVAVLAVGLALVATRSIEADMITLDHRSAVFLPPAGDLSLADRRLWDRIREQTLQALHGSGALLQTTRHPFWSDAARDDPNSWHADYALRVELTDANDHLRGELSLVPADSSDPSRREEFDADRSALARQIVSHASADLLVLLNPKAVAQMRDWDTSNVDAYRFAREGDSFQREPTVKSQAHAVTLFRRAVTEDPHFGYGYIQLAAVHAWAAWRAPTGTEHEQERDRLQALLREATSAAVNPRFLKLIEHLYEYASVSNAFDAEKYWHAKLIENSTDLDALIGYAELLVGAKLIDEGRHYIERAQTLPLPYGYADGLRLRYSEVANARGEFEEADRVMKQQLDTRPDDTLLLYGLAENLATLHRYEEAEVYLARLERGDPQWGFAARTVVNALEGELQLNSEALRVAFDNPLATNAMRSNVCFILGDVACGVRYGEQMELGSLRLCWLFQPSNEAHWPAGTVVDPRYQAELEELGIGRSWRTYMRQQAHTLAAVTGIDVTTPPPPEDL